MEGEQKDGDEQELYEATAGWDSYVSGLIAESKTAAEQASAGVGRNSNAAERRRKPRDRNVSRRRALLLNDAAGDTGNTD